MKENLKQIEVYNTYSSYLKDKFGEKVYKLPISLPLTCPNRDGTLGINGCIFCGEEGGSFENLSSSMSIKEQLNENKEYIGKRRSEEHTSELQSRFDLVCRLLLEKKKR